jgi:hypothetical protein
MPEMEPCGDPEVALKKFLFSEILIQKLKGEA